MLLSVLPTTSTTTGIRGREIMWITLMKIVCDIMMCSRHYNIKGWFLKKIILYVIIYKKKNGNTKFYAPKTNCSFIFNLSNVIIRLSEMFIQFTIHFIDNLQIITLVPLFQKVLHYY